MSRRGISRAEALLTLPSFGWLLFFFALPTLLVFAAAFRPADIFGGLGEGWTLANFLNLAHPSYPAIIWRTLWLTVLATAVCLGLAIPTAYAIARLSQRSRWWVLVLVILPFWTNFLIRIFAWRTLLHPEGWVARWFAALGIIEPGSQLLYNEWAVLVVLVYTHLPFAILPVYAAAERFDFGLLEAARDLGAGALGAFVRVFVPGVSKGLLTAFLVVFIPVLGSYAIPELVGGPGGEMIGNKIAQRALGDRNLPHAAALSALLTLVVLGPMVVYLLRQRLRERREQGGEGGRG